MFNLLDIRLFDFRHKAYRRVVYGLMSMVMVLGIGVATAQPSHAGWRDILIRGAIEGARVYQISNMTDEQEVAMGRDINNQLIGRGQINLFDNAALNNYVNDIGQKLAAVSDRPNIPYTFQVVRDSSVNAFATMGGYVYVTTGLLAAADNEAELASVIGHEIGHIVGGHAREHMRQEAITRGITGALGVNRDRLVNIGTEVALALPASRSAEYEADRLGFHNMGRAGYDQTGMVTFMQKLVRGRSAPEILSTHPDARNRVNSLQQLDSEAAIPSSTAGIDESSYASHISSLR